MKKGTDGEAFRYTNRIGETREIKAAVCRLIVLVVVQVVEGLCPDVVKGVATADTRVARVVVVVVIIAVVVARTGIDIELADVLAHHGVRVLKEGVLRRREHGTRRAAHHRRCETLCGRLTLLCACTPLLLAPPCVQCAAPAPHLRLVEVVKLAEERCTDAHCPL